MAQTDEILAELNGLDVVDRLKVIGAEVQRLRQQLEQDQVDDIWVGCTVEELAKRQGVRPVHDLDTLRADFWPEEESVDEFAATVRQWRDENRGI